MKHLKRFENLELQSEWGLILSDEEFKKSANDFDAIIEPYLEYADEGYELSFETAYGSRVIMNYDDYMSKNEKYQEFINGLHAGRSFFISTVKLPYDYNILTKFLNEIQVSIDRLSDNGWMLKEFDVKGIVEPRYSMPPRIIVKHEFEK